jgi:hypothetical protein
MEDNYEQAWTDSEPKVEAPAVTEPDLSDMKAPEPVPEVSSMKAEAASQADAQAKEFSDAFHADEPKKAMSFKEAFAKARKGGEKLFEFNGKKCTTALAPALKGEAKPKMARAASPAAPAAPAVQVADAQKAEPTGLIAELTAKADQSIANEQSARTGRGGVKL